MDFIPDTDFLSFLEDLPDFGEKEESAVAFLTESLPPPTVIPPLPLVEEIDGTLIPPTTTVEDERYFTYKHDLSLLKNIKRATELHKYHRNGHSFVSHRHLLAHDEMSEHNASRLYTRCMQRGNNHHVISQVVFDKTKRRWNHGRVKHDDEDEDEEEEDNMRPMDRDPMRFDTLDPNDDKITAPVMTFDKIKVMTDPYSDALMSKLNTANSLDGVETHKLKRIRCTGGGYKEVMKVNPAFPVHKTKFGPVPATRVTYKRNDYTSNYNAHGVEKPNNCNINGTRGTHEFIVVNRANEAHAQLNNPHGKMYTVLHMDCENNNSLTVDSAINSTVNMSYKSKICKKQDEKGVKRKRDEMVEDEDDDEEDRAHDDDEDGLCNNAEDGESRREFVLVQKAEYGTHKTTIMTKKKRFNLNKGIVGEMSKESHDEFVLAKKQAEKDQVLRAINAREVQVHAHCINCSALGGYEIIDAMRTIACKIFEDEKILVSIAANNAKGMIMAMSNSLSSCNINNFFDLCCWEYRVHRASEEKQDEFYKKVLHPIAKRMFVSRYAYSESGIFCNSVPKTSYLFSHHMLNLVSQKFNNPRATEVFQKAEEVDDDATRLDKKWNSKRPLATVNNMKHKPTTTKIHFANPLSRGQSPPDIWYHSTKNARKLIEEIYGLLDDSER